MQERMLGTGVLSSPMIEFPLTRVTKLRRQQLFIFKETKNAMFSDVWGLRHRHNLETCSADSSLSGALQQAPNLVDRIIKKSVPRYTYLVQNCRAPGNDTGNNHDCNKKQCLKEPKRRELFCVRAPL